MRVEPAEAARCCALVVATASAECKAQAASSRGQDCPMPADGLDAPRLVGATGASSLGWAPWQMCTKLASFGDAAVGPRPVACAAHRLAGHVDIRNPRCLSEGCTRIASFGPAAAAPQTCGGGGGGGTPRESSDSRPQQLAPLVCFGDSLALMLLR